MARKRNGDGMTTTTEHPFAEVLQAAIDAGGERAAHAEALLRDGLPTRREEAWRFINLKPVHEFKPTGAKAEQPTDLFPDLPRLVFLNGFAQVDSARGLDGITVREAKPADSTHAFDRLTNAMAKPIELVIEQSLDAPLMLDFSSSDLTTPNVVITIAPNATATIIERHRGSAGAFESSVTRIHVGQNAELKLHRAVHHHATGIHIGTVHAQLERDARFSASVASLGGRIARTELTGEMIGTGSECRLRGLAIGKGDAHHDFQINVEHKAPQTTSQQLFRCILDDKSHGVFDGRVYVADNALGTDAHQTNNNLLLSDDAVIDTKPQLEIYTDDVKCSHGATSGQLSDEALFFLRSRGLPKQAARALLTSAFAHEVVQTIDYAPLRERLDARIDEVLA